MLSGALRVKDSFSSGGFDIHIRIKAPERLNRIHADGKPLNTKKPFSFLKGFLK